MDWGNHCCRLRKDVESKEIKGYGCSDILLLLRSGNKIFCSEDFQGVPTRPSGTGWLQRGVGSGQFLVRGKNLSTRAEFCIWRAEWWNFDSFGRAAFEQKFCSWCWEGCVCSMQWNVDLGWVGSKLSICTKTGRKPRDILIDLAGRTTLLMYTDFYPGVWRSITRTLPAVRSCPIAAVLRSL